MQTANIKTSAHELIDQLPETVSWSELAYHIEVRASIEQGMADIEAGRLIDGDKVMTWLESWGTDNELEPPTT